MKRALQEEKVVIFGAGNVGRGLLGRVFRDCGYAVTFVEADSKLAAKLRTSASYTVMLTGEREESVMVNGFDVVEVPDLERITALLAEADIAVTAVGPAALPMVIKTVARGLQQRARKKIEKPLNVLVCENMREADKKFRTYVLEGLGKDIAEYIDTHLGTVRVVVECMIKTEPLQDEETIPAVVAEAEEGAYFSRTAFIGEVPQVPLLEAVDDLTPYEERKLFTNNMGHAVLGYLGYQRRLKTLVEAMQDEWILEILNGALHEAAAVLKERHSFEVGAMARHLERLKCRYANVHLSDTVQRVARDPIRKLGPEERLVAPAQLSLKIGQDPQNLCTAIAGALLYDNPEDKEALDLQRLHKEIGIDGVLEDICGISRSSRLAKLVKIQGNF